MSIIKTFNAIIRGEEKEVEKELKEVMKSIEGVTEGFMRMRDRCDPHIFYSRVRPFVSGWANNEKLPHGLIYEGVNEKPLFYNGLFFFIFLFFYLFLILI